MAAMNQNPGLALDPSNQMYKLISNIPDYNSNPVGSVARKELVNKLKVSLPGRHTQPWPMPKGNLFVDIFYPGVHSPRYDVAKYTRLSNQWWSDFSVAILCQSMYWQTSDIRRQLLINQINTKVSSHNATLQGRAVQWYSHVLLQDYLKYSGDFRHAVKVYKALICTERWVTFKMKQYTDGTWNNPEWELFHHWAKLSALGASDNEINEVINKLRNLGLRIFPDVDVDTWRRYFVWYSPSSLDHKDVDKQARKGELKEVCRTFMGSPYPSCMKEENCFEFTANSQPGSSYRQVPSSSCFSSTTKVLMSDGSLKEIKNVKPGELVQTPSGSRKVLLVATPMRNQRLLYGINGNSDFLFTATHPFVSGVQESSQTHFLAVSPLLLAHMTPMLSYTGISRLGQGSYLSGFSNGTLLKIPVHSVEEYPATGSDQELLYDVILEPNHTGQFEYIVGNSKESLYVVASELPIFSNAVISELLASVVLMEAITSAAESLLMLHNSTSNSVFKEKLTEISHRLLPLLLQQTSKQGTNTTSKMLVKMRKPADFSEYIQSKLNTFSLPNGAYNPATGETFAYLSAETMHPLACALQLGYRIIEESTNIDTMAVTLCDYQITSIASFSNTFTNPMITIQVNESRIEFKVENNRVARGGRIHKIFYTPLQTLHDEVIVEIHIKSAVSHDSVLKCSTHVVFLFSHNFRSYRLPLFFGDEEVGFLHFDLHLLSSANAEAEKTASKDWNDDRMCKFTENLMKLTGDTLIKLCVK